MNYYKHEQKQKQKQMGKGKEKEERKEEKKEKESMINNLAGIMYHENRGYQTRDCYHQRNEVSTLYLTKLMLDITVILGVNKVNIVDNILVSTEYC